MYESRGKGSQISLPTKIWLIFVRIFSGWNTPKLYSYQGSLPRLPLPALHDTTTRVLILFLELIFKTINYVFRFSIYEAFDLYWTTLIMLAWKN